VVIAVANKMDDLDGVLGSPVVIKMDDAENATLGEVETVINRFGEAGTCVSYLPDAALVNPMETLVNYETGDEVVIAVATKMTLGEVFLENPKADFIAEDIPVHTPPEIGWGNDILGWDVNHENGDEVVIN